jgi:hypothetical protein
MLNTDVRRAIGANQSKQEHLMPLAALMVHVDMDHDSEKTVELAIALAERFQATLIGVAGCALWPAFMAGDARLTNANQYDFQKVMARFEQRGKKFCARGRHRPGPAAVHGLSCDPKRIRAISQCECVSIPGYCVHAWHDCHRVSCRAQYVTSLNAKYRARSRRAGRHHRLYSEPQMTSGRSLRQ